MLSAMKNPERPRDPNQLGKLIVALSVGEADEDVPADNKNPAAVALGKLGGEARAANLSKKDRASIAKKAAKARWNKRK